MSIRKNVFIAFISFLFSFSTVDAQQNQEFYKNACYGSFARQGLVHVKYERYLYSSIWTSTLLNAGLGILPIEESPDLKIITLEAGQLIGYKAIHVEIGIEASFNFIDNFSYTDINGIFGLRYQPRDYNSEGMVFQLGFSPHLYQTFSGWVDLPFYAGIGVSF